MNNIIYYLLGLITAWFGLGNILVTLIHDLPYAKKIAKTHKVANAQRIDGKFGLWYGPLPYGRILLGSVLFLAIGILVFLIIALKTPQHIKDFGIGILLFLILIPSSFHDPNQRFKRDFNLKFGDNWFSKSSNGTLRDEQKKKDSI